MININETNFMYPLDEVDDGIFIDDVPRVQLFGIEHFFYIGFAVLAVVWFISHQTTIKKIKHPITVYSCGLHSLQRLSFTHGV